MEIGDEVEDPDTLARVISQLGGTMVADPNAFTFDLPLGEVKTVVSKLSELGVGTRKASEYVGDHPTKLFSPITVARLQLHYRGED